MLSESFQGPIPPPSVLERYSAIDAKIPLMILEMAMKEQDYRHRIEQSKIEIVDKKIEEQAVALRNDFKFGTRGQWLTFVTATVFLAVLAFFGYLGLETAICWGFGTGGFIVISRFFVLNRSDKLKEDSLPSARP